VSVINRMLRDLDERHALADQGVQVLPSSVRVPAPPPRADPEWFWRIVAVLMLTALGWVGLVLYKTQLRPIATERAFNAAEERRRAQPRAVAPVAPRIVPSNPAAAPVVTAAPSAPVLAAAIHKDPAKPRASAKPEAAAVPSSAAAATKPVATKSAERRNGGGSARTRKKPRNEASPSAVKTHQSARNPKGGAERQYALAVAVLRTGHGSVAEKHFTAALDADPAHENARQALVALKIDSGDIAAARTLLEQGLAQNPQQTRFAVVLARIYVEQGDYAGALRTLDAARTGLGAGADLHALRGAVLRQLNRPADAADAYRDALRIAPGAGALWIGLALSLEALGQLPEAAESFRRAAATGTLSADLRAQAETRARSLE